MEGGMDARHRSNDGISAQDSDFYAIIQEQGYCIVSDVVPQTLVDAINRDLDCRFSATPFCEGEFYGPTTKRFGSLLLRSRQTQALIQHPTILNLVQKILGPYCDNFNVNLTQAIEIHPGAPEQLQHRDQDMWGGPKGAMEYLVNVMWPLVPFTAENGATVVWPKSHRDQQNYFLPRGDAVPAEMDVGSALVFLGSTLHGGGANRSIVPRRGIIISYCLGWLKPFENQWLVYPPSIASDFSPELARLVGYSIHRPNLGNYEGQCPSVLLGSDLPEFLAAKDALSPEHYALMSQMLMAREQGPL